MKEKNENEKLQSRREFFKNAAKAALPVVGAVVLANLPTVEAKAKAMGCQHGCEYGCYDSCMGGCQGGCHDSCKGKCKGTCFFGCNDSCKSYNNNYMPSFHMGRPGDSKY